MGSDRVAPDFEEEGFNLPRSAIATNHKKKQQTRDHDTVRYIIGLSRGSSPYLLFTALKTVHKNILSLCPESLEICEEN